VLSTKPKLSVPSIAMVPPPGAGSPTAAKRLTMPACQVKTSARYWLLFVLRARNTTSRSWFSEPGPSAVNTPPSGDGSPTPATLTIVAVEAT
jgi:hypothetical protein